MHQYLTTKNIINSKNAQSHLAFDQTPSICTVHICKKIQKFQKIGRRLAAAPLLLLSSPSPLLLLFNASGPAATMEQGRQRARGTRAQERRSIGTMGKGGAHFEGGGDGRSPATRTAGSGRHAVTGTAVSGRQAATGTWRGGLGEARGDGDDEDGGLRDAGDEDGAGSGRRRRWRRRRRRRGARERFGQPGGGGNWRGRRGRCEIFTSPGYIARALVPVGATNRYQCTPLVPVGGTNRDQRPLAARVAAKSLVPPR